MVRLAESRDVPSIVRLGLRFLRESPFAVVIAENAEQMARLASDLIGGVRDGVIYMADDADGFAIGMIGGLFYEHPIGGEPMVTELFWFVDPEARGSAGIRLIKALDKWTEARGAVGLQMVSPMGAERVEAIYRALGFVPVEVGWQKRCAPRVDLDDAVAVAVQLIA